MPQLEFHAQVGEPWGVLGVDIRELIVMDTSGSTLTLVAVTGPGGGMMSLQFANGQMQCKRPVCLP